MDAPYISTGNYDLTKQGEISSLTSDFVAGDLNLYKKYLGEVDFQVIQKALNFLLNNPNISASQRSILQQRSWSIVYKRKPPTIEEFLTYEYIGRQADNTYPHIRKVITEFLDPYAPYRDLVLAPFIGFGKLSAYDARVYTPAGYKLMRDLQVGDVVSTPNGKTANVIEKKDFPDEPLYRFTFADGRSTIVGGEHLWKVAATPTPFDSEWHILTTNDLLESGSDHWYIPLTEPVYHNPRKLPKAPYALGEELRLSDTVSDTIPDAYMYTSIQSRRMLLRGLLGLEREAKLDVITSFKTSSVSLRDTVTQLVRGLGGKATASTTFCPTTSRPSYTLLLEMSKKFTTLAVTSMTPLDSKGGACIVLDDEDHLYLTDDYIVTHNSTASVLITLFITTHIALMRDSKKYFNQAASAVLCQALISYSLKKSSEILLEPFMNILDVSEFFEKVHTREGMVKRDREFESAGEQVDRIFWTTAAPSSAIQFSNGANIKMISNVQNLLGLSIVSAVLSELSFFKEAGKALALDTPILYPGGYKPMSEVQVGDIIVSPTSDTTEVVAIPWEDVDDLYEIAFDNGKTIQCNLDHLWPVTYTNEAGVEVSEVVPTRFMLENTHLDFDVQAFEAGIARIASIRKVGRAPQKCITVSNPDGLFIANGMQTHNSDEYIMRVYTDTKERIESRMKGNWFGRSILDSSPDSYDNSIDRYVWEEAPHDPTVYLVRGARWEWQPEEFEGDTKFPIYLGGPGKPPAILESTEGYDVTDLMYVPQRLRKFFDADLVRAIKNIGGRPSGNVNKLLYDTENIERMFDDRLKNLYLHLHVPSELSPKGAIWNQMYKDFFRNTGSGLSFYYRPEIPRVFSIDQSINGDTTGISVAHAELLSDGSTLTVFDFTVVLHPLKHDINLDAIRYFIEDLVVQGHMMFSMGSFDQFQSASARQGIERDLGIPITRLSVDSTMDPYKNFVSDIRAGRVKAGKNIYIKNNLKSLIFSKRKRSGTYKVDHTLGEPADPAGDSRWDTSLIGYHAKDITDSMAAAADLLRQQGAPLHMHNDFEELRFIEAIVDSPEAFSTYLEANRNLKKSIVPWN